MDSTDLLRAVALAHEAHAKDLDRNGLPYVFHVMRVADRQTTLERRIIALLHDTVEHKKLTLQDIEQMFTKAIAYSVGLLSQRDNENYLTDYLQRVLQDEDACWVKLADVEDNTRIDRIDAKAARKFEKYRTAHEALRRRLGVTSPYELRSILNK